MLDEKSRGISLRSKRKAGLTISGPLPQGQKGTQSTGRGSGKQGVGDTVGLNGPAERGRRLAYSGASSSAGGNSGNGIATVVSSKGNDGSVRRRDQGQINGRTSDLVKRRYSTRFGHAPDMISPTSGPGLPPVPDIDERFRKKYQPEKPGVNQFDAANTATSGTSSFPGTLVVSGSGPGGGIKIDPSVLRNTELIPEQYVASVLCNATEADIAQFRLEMMKLKNRTSTDLQHNVFQNRAQFIKISKEVELVRNEMKSLREFIAELMNILSQTSPNEDMGNSESRAARKQANRTSLANLEAMWMSHLQSLWKRVDGSQKFIPPTPGRHIVYESGHWVELNAATWKLKRRVHLILLNDHLLVAVDRKRNDMANSGNGNSNAYRDANVKQGACQQAQLVARYCWPVQDIQMTSITTRRNSRQNEGISGDNLPQNAINVRIGSDSFTYATVSSDDTERTTLLATFRKTAEDIWKLIELESEKREKAAKSMSTMLGTRWNFLRRFSSSLNLSLTSAATATVSDAIVTKGSSLRDGNSRRNSTSVEIDGKQQSLRSIDGLLDDLDIEIALQHFEESVSQVEQLRKLAKGIKSNVKAQFLLTSAINERSQRLAGILIRSLISTHSWETTTRGTVSWLMRLGCEDQAREAFLQARTEVIRKRVRQCTFDGDLHMYIFQISYIYFTIMRNTVNIYQSCFPTTTISACIKWAKDRLDDFNHTLLLQLNSVDSGSTVWRNCMNRARIHAAIMDDVNLDFKSLVGVVDEEIFDDEDNHGHDANHNLQHGPENGGTHGGSGSE